MGFFATVAKLRRPATTDGFDAVITVRFDGRGGFECRQDDPPTAG